MKLSIIRAITILLFSLQLLGCIRNSVNPYVLRESASVMVVNQSSKVKKRYEKSLYDFFSDSKIKNTILTSPSLYSKEAGGSGGSSVIVSLLDITGDDIPEVIITSTHLYSGVVFMGEATAYDLYKKQPLLSFYESNSPILRYRDTNGKFMCLVYESLYMGEGICNTFIQQLVFDNGIGKSETKYFLEHIYFDENDSDKKYYAIYQDIPQLYIDEFHRYVEGEIPDLSKVDLPTTTSDAMLSYITSLIPQETIRTRLGYFMNNNFYGDDDYSELAQMINKTYFY